MIVHEIGHELGLFHPFNYVSFNEFDSLSLYSHTNRLFDFISIPMTYAHYDTSFSTFDRDSIARAHIFKYINKTWQFLYNANQILLSKNYRVLNPMLENKLNQILSNKSICWNFY